MSWHRRTSVSISITTRSCVPEALARIMNTRRTHHNGFTLLEVLVSLVVLSIGLLGIGKLMMFSSRANDSAYMRSQATALAYSILDDMRANEQDAINGLYNTGLGAYGNPGFTCNLASPCTVSGQLS